MKLYKYLLPVLLVLPVVAGAQGGLAGGDSGAGPVGPYITAFIDFINTILVPLVFAIAFLVFLWGVFSYFILGGGNEDKRETGKMLMLYAIIGFVLMVSIWGIVNLIAGGLGLEQDSSVINIPDTPTTRN